jgi:hypothetical protein
MDVALLILLAMAVGLLGGLQCATATGPRV